MNKIISPPDLLSATSKKDQILLHDNTRQCLASEQSSMVLSTFSKLPNERLGQDFIKLDDSKIPSIMTPPPNIDSNLQRQFSRQPIQQPPQQCLSTSDPDQCCPPTDSLQVH